LKGLNGGGSFSKDSFDIHKDTDKDKLLLDGL
jgi:hypothetical protein